MSPRGQHLRRVLAGLAVVALTASCTNIFGLDAEYDDAALTLCLCQDLLDRFQFTQPECRKFVNLGLKKATVEEQAAWLKIYEDNKCDTCTTASGKRTECLFARPVCTELGQPCTDPLACCGFVNFQDENDAKSACLPSGSGTDRTCQACVPMGSTCTTSEECCGYPYVNTNGYDPPYCDPATSKCTREQSGCTKTGGGCLADNDCCGAEIGKGHCSGSHFCEEECDPADPVNCPGCCAHISGGIGQFMTNYTHECLDGKDISRCPTLCTIGGTECTAPAECQNVCSKFGVCLDICQ